MTMGEGTAEERPVALVTGASYGIGGATAVGLAADGFDIVVTDLDASHLADTQRKIEAAGARSLALGLDVRDQHSIDRCFADAVSEFGHVDLVVNNAGVPSPRKPIVDTTREDWHTIIDVNLTGVFFFSQAFARHLIAQERPGHVISLASTFGIIGQANVSVYGISKAAVSHMTKMMAIEWAELGIRANAVAPGATTTESRAKYHHDPVLGPRARAKIPIGRFAQPDEVAAAIRYLASPSAAYINGHTLVLDGGLTVA
jgi:NAD(P)-dependent dehydrogenase (short-subunit alcohol dehydrogenase family)